MKVRTWIVGIGALAASTLPAPGLASLPTASCIGQQLSTYGPAYGAELGAAVSFEARNPSVLGTSNLGGWTNVAARSARDACPVD